MKSAIIFGVNGQDGSYLSELLIEKGYRVFGVVRRSSTNTFERLTEVVDNTNFHLCEGDIIDPSSVNCLINKYKPDELYNLAAQSVTEDCLVPIKSAGKVTYRTFNHLWNNLCKKDNKIIIEHDVEVINLDNKINDICALGFWNGMGTWFKIKQISRHYWKDQVVRLSQKFGQVTVTPNHSILDVNNKICKPSDNPWLLNIRKFNYTTSKIYNSISLDVINKDNEESGYIWKNEKGINGKIKKVVSGDEISALCRFLGAFISEGWTSYNKVNNTYNVCICQQDKSWLKQLEQDLDKFFIGNRCYVEHKKDGFENVWRLEIKSRALFTLIRKWCGLKSDTKCLPEWFSQLDKFHLKELWRLLYEGDGCEGPYGGWRYSTTSYKLSCQLSWLFTYLEFDYTVHFLDDEKTKKNNWKPSWHFRQCFSYAPEQGKNGKNIEYLDYDGWVYDISVEEVNNFAVGVGNIVVHNSHVHTSFEQPFYTFQVNAVGVLNILEGVRNYSPKTKVYQASTSELFGSNYDVDESGNKYQDENTRFSPNSPYAVAKLAAHELIRLYRDSYGIFACSGLIFNHESPRRGENFVTRKITKWIGKLINIIPLGGAELFLKDGIVSVNKTNKRGQYIGGMEHGSLPLLKLGNLNAVRDWSHVKDMVEGMWMMLQQDYHNAKDYVLCSGIGHSVRDFLEIAFRHVDIDNWENFVEIDSALYRPCEVEFLQGKYDLAKKELGWEPKISFKELVREMVQYDIDQAIND